MSDINLMLTEIGKLLLAVILGGAIGLERESHGQAAGVRTNIIICVSSCLMMMLSLHIEEIYRNLNNDSVIRLDPARIASYTIAGMGFLGAGAIIKGRGSIRGLTTAASLWLGTGIGLAVGAGYLFPAIASTLMSLLVLYGLRQIKPFFQRDIHTVLVLQFHEIERPLEQILRIFAEIPKLSIQFINYKQNISSQTTTYCLRLLSKENLDWEEIVKRLTELKGLEEIRWEEGNVP